MDVAVISTIASLCQRAVDASLPFDDFHRLWPPESKEDEFLRECFEDVEACVEHLPADWSGNIAPDWYTSKDRLLVVLDLYLLKWLSEAPSEKLLHCRRQIAKLHLAKIDIEQQVRRCLSQSEPVLLDSMQRQSSLGSTIKETIRKLLGAFTACAH